MRTLTAAMVVALTAATAHGADLSTKETDRIRQAATVLQEIHTVPDKDIPDELCAPSA
jgi:lipid-binding SYLF domain-containing protein